MWEDRGWRGSDIPTSADVLLETPITHFHIKMFVRYTFFTSSGRQGPLELDASRWGGGGALKTTVRFNLARSDVVFVSVQFRDDCGYDYIL